jgi:hypothetical protein
VGNTGGALLNSGEMNVKKPRMRFFMIIFFYYLLFIFRLIRGMVIGKQIVVSVAAHLAGNADLLSRIIATVI